MVIEVTGSEGHYLPSINVKYGLILYVSNHTPQRAS